jgi:hypothetical protein
MQNRSVDRAGHHRVDGNSAGGPLTGDRASEPDQTSLRRGVVRLAGGPHQAGHRSHVDDSTPPAADHGPHRAAYTVERPVQVRAQDKVPVTFRHRGNQPVPDDPGIVHECLDRTPSPLDLAEHEVYVIRIPDVAVNLYHVAARIGNALRAPARAIAIGGVADRHSMPAGRECPRYRLSDAAGGARD